MRDHITSVVSVVAVLACSTGIAWAERCIGPKDNSAAVARGVDPIAAEDIVWCDDFDSYCEANRLAESIWPGFPPTPDNLCGTSDTASTQWFQDPVHWPKDYTGTRLEVTTGPTRWEGWDGNPGWETEPYNVENSGGSSTAQYHTFDLGPAITHAFGEGYDTINGTDENPLVLRFWMYHLLIGGAPNSPLYVELKLNDEGAPVDYVEMDCMGFNDCTCALLHPDAYCATDTCNAGECHQWYCGLFGTCEDGPRAGQTCGTNEDCLSTCDADPEGTVCTSDADCGTCANNPSKNCDSDADCGACVGGNTPGAACDSDYDCRFACGPEEQSVCDSGPSAGVACEQDSECAGWPIYPIVNQQNLSGAIAVPHPPKTSYNPEDSNYRIWSSVAFGLLAQLDGNPCDQGTGKKPTSYHVAVFNGHQWQDLRANQFPPYPGLPAGKDFNYYDGQAFFELKVKSTTIEVKLIAPLTTTMDTVISSAINIPRRYLGPFNRISIGAGPGCKLAPEPDPVTGLPVCDGPADIWRYPSLYPGSGWSAGWIDRPALLGGLPGSAQGACCLPNGSCVDDGDSATCIQAGGVFRGMETTCEAGTCLGACCAGYNCTDTLISECSTTFLGVGTSCAIDECPCPDPFADSDGDGDVDQADFARFQACYTGSGGSVAVGCACFDAHPTGGGDNDIDSEDWGAFEACASGAGIAADAACDDVP